MASARVLSWPCSLATELEVSTLSASQSPSSPLRFGVTSTSAIRCAHLTGIVVVSRSPADTPRQTLLTIANNVISQSDPKFRDLKASNSTLKNKVLAVKGGHEYLIRVSGSVVGLAARWGP